VNKNKVLEGLISMNKIKAAVLGSTGYVGQELTRLLIQHPQVDIVFLGSKSYKEQSYSDIYANFSKNIELICYEDNVENIASKVDVVFIALPHGHASGKINKNILSKTKIIDLGADFRLNDEKIYENWYETKHNCPDLLKTAVYGLCELNRNEIRTSNLIANPGCYTTCSILTLAPLLKEDLIDENTIIIDAKSGVSGAGRSLNLGTHFCETNESIKAYKVASHRHTPEIEQELSKISGKEIKLSFTPHLIPMNRGIISTCYASLKENISYDDVKSAYEKHYGNEFFIRLMKKGVFPETRWVKGSNFVDIGFSIDERTRRIIAIGALDNLMKGAASQAVQNMNIMFEMDESTGINQIPAFPI